MNLASGGVLSDQAIRAALDEGSIKIDPFEAEQLNPVSYDLTLGGQVTVYKGWVETESYTQWSLDKPKDGRLLHAVQGTFDVKKKPEFESFQMDPKEGWVIKPGIGYLMHTRERIWTEKFIPVIDGKSSIGRLFIQIHITAGFGDPGFDGQYTLEVVAQHPVRVYPGMRIAQIRFHTIAGELVKLYQQTGHYTGEHAVGAVPSQAWRQFPK